MAKAQQQAVVTLREARDSVEAINELLATSLPLHLAHRVNLLVDEIRPKIETFEALRNGKFEKWGAVDPDNPEIRRIQPEYLDKFNTEVEKALSEELTFSVPRIKRSEFPSDTRITPLALKQLEWLIING